VGENAGGGLQNALAGMDGADIGPDGKHIFCLKEKRDNQDSQRQELKQQESVVQGRRIVYAHGQVSNGICETGNLNQPGGQPVKKIQKACRYDGVTDKDTIGADEQLTVAGELEHHIVKQDTEADQDQQPVESPADVRQIIHKAEIIFIADIFGVKKEITGFYHSGIKKDSSHNVVKGKQKKMPGPREAFRKKQDEQKAHDGNELGTENHNPDKGIHATVEYEKAFPKMVI